MSKDYYVQYRGINKFAAIVLKTFLRSVFRSHNSLMASVTSFVNVAIGEKNKLNCITPSGRTALYSIFSLPNVQTVLLPEYICNVVPMAAHGKRIQYYSVGSDYQYTLKEIIRIVTEKPDCCIVLSSYLDRRVQIDEMIRNIRAISDKCIIVFDECQNIQSITELPVLDDNTYAVYSLNNKMTYGFMGGFIIQGKNNKVAIQKFKPAPLADSIHGMYVVLRKGIMDVVSAIKGDYHIPDDPEVSQGKGIYSVQYKGILKVSIAAASLINENWEWYLSCMKNNHSIAKELERKGVIGIIQGCTDSLMPYIPIQNDKSIYGKLPIKGRYGGLSSANGKRNICLELHNSMKMEIIDK